MDVNRIELIEALTKIKPGIANKEFLEQSTHFILNENEIISYNDEISIAYPFEIGVKCTVEQGLLFKLVSKMEEDTITFNLKKNELKLECGDVKAKLPIVPNSEIFEYVNKLSKEQDELEWHELPKDFLDGIKLCAFSASTDKTLGTLTCVWIEGNEVLSTDKYRASWYKMKEKVEENFYIESTYISELENFDFPVEYCLSKSWVHFQMSNGIVFSARLTIPDELLNIREKFEKFEHSVRIPIPRSLAFAVDTVSLAIESKEKLDQKVKIEFGEDLIRCIGSSEKGTIEKEIHLEKPLSCDPFAISTTPRSLIEVLDKVTHLLIGKRAGLFINREKKGFQHLIGLIIEED